MSRRPDLVDVWVFRATATDPSSLEILLLRRAAGRIMAGLWQGVSGAVEAGDTVVGAARRELLEETGFDGAAIDAFYSLDLVAEFLWEPSDALLSSAYFAARVRPHAEPVLSHEHDEARWVPVDEALALAVWPAYREAIGRIRDNLADPERARWFEVEG